MRFFLKEQPGQAVYDSNGRPLPFTPIDDSYGFMITDNAYLIAQCDAAIRGRIGGVINSTQEDIDAKKKAANSALPSSQKPDRFVSSQSIARLAANRAATKSPFGIDMNGRPRDVVTAATMAPTLPTLPANPTPLEIPRLPRVTKNPS
jgi:hypothetical protein